MQEQYPIDVYKNQGRNQTFLGFLTLSICLMNETNSASGVPTLSQGLSGEILPAPLRELGTSCLRAPWLCPGVSPPGLYAVSVGPAILQTLWKGPGVS